MDIETRLTTYISEELIDGDHAIEPQDRLLAEGLVDSLGVMRLVSYIGESFGIDVPAEDVVLENFGSVSRMAAYLRGRGI